MRSQQEMLSCLQQPMAMAMGIKLTSALVMCCDIEDAIGINFESDLNLRYPPGCRGNACQIKLAQLVVVLGHGSLTLIHLHNDSQTLFEATTFEVAIKNCAGSSSMVACM